MTGTQYRRSDKTLFSELGDDVVALQVEQGHCYAMENSTAAIWALLAEPRDVDEICLRLREIYEVDPDTCRTDVEGIIRQLEDEKLIEAVGTAA